MKSLLISAGVLLVLALSSGSVRATEGLAGQQVICCGGADVFVIDPVRPAVRVWSWRASDSPSIPEAFRSRFQSTDDCKPYKGGLILVTSSSGGVALVERDTKVCRFLAEAKNAHSACLLPNQELVVAASFGGDELQFYRLADRHSGIKDQPAKPFQAIPLVGAHGVVWDKKRRCLWALGEEEVLKLAAAEQAEAAGRWSVTQRRNLPTRGGHDLSPAHDGSHLFVTTNSQVLLLDQDKMTFQTDDRFGDGARIKSVDCHPVEKRIVFHQASQEHWWSDTIRFVNQDALRLDTARLYKVRWDVPMDRP